MAALVALTALAALLRFATLDAQSFWLDESVTVKLVRLGFLDMFRAIPGSESTPPLYYLVAWLWSKLFGSGEVALRSLSALLGTATIPLAYGAARELCSRRVGLAVAALAAVNPVLIWYSQEARSYALLVVLAAISLWSFARLLDRPSGRAAAVWGAASALALLSHYFAVFLVLPELVWLAAAPVTRRHALPALAAVAAVGLALLPLALHQKGLDLASFISGDSLLFRTARAGKNFLVGFDSPLERELAPVAVAIALAGAAAGLAWARGPERRGLRLAGALGAAAIVLPCLLALAGVDYLDTRNLLAAWIPLMTVVATGLVATRAGIAALAVLGLLGLSGVIGVALEPDWQRENWRGMVHALGPPSGPRVLIAPATGRRPLEVYLPLRDLPQAGASVREVALLYPVRRKAGEEHPLPPPRLEPAPPPGFEVVERRRDHGYAVVLLRAPRPLPFTIVQALGLRPVQTERVAVLLQRHR